MKQITYSGFVRTSDRFYSLGEEIANAITHGIACIASIVGLVFLIIYASGRGQTLDIVTFSIFGSCLIILYLASTLYHAIPISKIKSIFRIIDHSAIFLLIAGSYTPFMLNLLNNATGITICVIVWIVAILGVALQPWLIRMGDKINTALYLMMGWLVIFAFKAVYDALPLPGLILLISGGLLYSLGCIFFVWQRLPYHHAIWHVFVLAGSATHYFAILLYTI